MSGMSLDTAVTPQGRTRRLLFSTSPLVPASDWESRERASELEMNQPLTSHTYSNSLVTIESSCGALNQEYGDGVYYVLMSTLANHLECIGHSF